MKQAHKWVQASFFCGKGAELRCKEMRIIMNGKIDSNLVQYDSQECLRSHRLIGVWFNDKREHFLTGPDSVALIFMFFLMKPFHLLLRLYIRRSTQKILIWSFLFWSAGYLYIVNGYRIAGVFGFYTWSELKGFAGYGKKWTSFWL